MVCFGVRLEQLVRRERRTRGLANFFKRADFLQTAQKLAAFGALTSSLAAAGSAQAADLAAATSAVSGDNRAALLATLFIPALGWVAYNILGPALNQYENMRLKYALKSFRNSQSIVAVGLATSLVLQLDKGASI